MKPICHSTHCIWIEMQMEIMKCKHRNPKINQILISILLVWSITRPWAKKCDCYSRSHKFKGNETCKQGQLHQKNPVCYCWFCMSVSSPPALSLPIQCQLNICILLSVAFKWIHVWHKLQKETHRKKKGESVFSNQLLDKKHFLVYFITNLIPLYSLMS